MMTQCEDSHSKTTQASFDECIKLKLPEAYTTIGSRSRRAILLILGFLALSPPAPTTLLPLSQLAQRSHIHNVTIPIFILFVHACASRHRADPSLEVLADRPCAGLLGLVRVRDEVGELAAE